MFSPNSSPINACVCPLCGKPNQCAMEAEKQTGKSLPTCWCVNTLFSTELLAQVPPAARNKACICQECAMKEAHD